MKKYFMFVAVAAAGMLASCSSDSLTAGSDPTIEPTQEERVPIQLAVSSPSVRANTRGTGTVGSVETDAANNKWYGQTINAFMFVKGTLTPATETDGTTELYNNAPMYTPGNAANVPDPTPKDKGEAMLTNGDIKYYPPLGNFDFFGYHGDDALTGAVDVSADPWVVPFTIDGTQDLMSTKASMTNDEQTAWNTAVAEEKRNNYYSAYAARKELQPTLQFDHLLSRLTFVIKAGNKNAAGWEDPGPQDLNKAVKVKSIEVESKTTGKMAVAWTAANPEKISWTDGGSPAWLSLKERPAFYFGTDKTVTISQAEYDARPYYSKVSDASVHISPAEWGALPTDAYYYEIADPTHHITPAAYEVLTEDEQAEYAVGDVQGDFTEVTTTGFVAVGADVANYNLTNLTPTAPTTANGTDFDEVKVGEALIVAPKDEAYKMRVSVAQNVKTNWDGTIDTKEMTYELDIPAPTDDPGTDEDESGFQANTSYKVILTVYGFERIVVTTEIIPWAEGDDIEVGQDD
jgi:hypothetical protein